MAMMNNLMSIVFAIVAVSGAEVSIITAYHNTCSVYNNELRCWGNNDKGQLGIGSTTDLYQPPEDRIDLGDGFLVKSAAMGRYHVCAVSTNGSSKCFGNNDYGQLGQGSTADLGNQANEMGANLPAIDWGTGFVVDQIACGFWHTCALSTNGTMKCVGIDDYGELGAGTGGQQRGDSTAEMGNALVAIDWGSEFETVWMGLGRRWTCALSASNELKCIGWNAYGQLGQGDTTKRGESADTLGDNLPAIDLGTDFEIMSARPGIDHICVLSTNADLKCFGRNNYGQLGYGDTTNRGTSANQMGDFLPVVDLGSGFIIEDISVNSESACALSAGAVKCWGRGNEGQLGYEDADSRGDESDEMAEYLPTVDLGTDFIVQRISRGDSGRSFCVSGETGTKCFGSGADGRLGYGDTQNRGDSSGDMGDALPFVELGFTMTPSVEPTNAPTSAAPTTATPTSVPTTIPSVSPTDPQCDVSAMHAVIWHDLLNEDDQDTALLHGYNVTFDASTLSLTFSASVEYVGRSADGNFDDDFNLGTSYWIDFQSFSSIDGGIDSVGNCANRRSSDYTNLTFGQFWNYTVNPADLESASTAGRTAYPPSDWNLTASSCNVVEFERTFSWTEMTGCLDAEGSGTIDVTETEDTISLSGTFFVELVSPYSMSMLDYYRTYPLLQQDFSIVLDRQVDALASTGVQLFISSVMAYGRDDEGNYEMTILVQSADYVMLGMGNDSVTAISSPLAVSNIETVTGDCLVASSFTCGQIFTATIPETCSANDSDVDLSGTYQFGFTPKCQTLDDGSEDPACTTFLSTLDSDNKVVLDVDSSFTDSCDVDLFSVTFDANLTFYKDDTFVVGASDPFVIGQDTIYGKVVVNTPSDPSGEIYEFVDVSIENVYVCTAGDTADLGLDADSGVGGCLSGDIDADGPYNVIGTGAVAEYQGMTYAVSGSEATFSFLTFDTPRTTINVHVQLLLTVEAESGERRRRMLLQSGSESDEGNAFRSFIGTASVAEEETTADPFATDGAVSFSGGLMPAIFALTAYVLGYNLA